ncbi:hypothetical protein [Leptothoe spongobia]|uniref:Uncharacterized protein n=1 Tax=Leptothoe spongobia TAU-MAC 1115 TaxID=1967444 RepID=A0A947DD62_9CYAN|nr:hypothetical protein [Leptothoe spongobia]MBT9314842.1 hypothetical protein [Leptothoe spongobia TAU-MAC 1115]
MTHKTLSPRQILNALRVRRLGWLVPFYCCIDSYYTENGLEVLSVFTWRFGRQAWETWRLKEGVNADSVELKTAPSKMYDRLRLSGDLVHRHCLGGS